MGLRRRPRQLDEPVSGGLAQQQLVSDWGRAVCGTTGRLRHPRRDAALLLARELVSAHARAPAPRARRRARRTHSHLGCCTRRSRPPRRQRDQRSSRERREWGAIRKGPHRPATVSSRPSARSLHLRAFVPCPREREWGLGPARRGAPPIRQTLDARVHSSLVECDERRRCIATDFGPRAEVDKGGNAETCCRDLSGIGRELVPRSFAR